MHRGKREPLWTAAWPDLTRPILVEIGVDVVEWCPRGGRTVYIDSVLKVRVGLLSSEVPPGAISRSYSAAGGSGGGDDEKPGRQYASL